MNLLEFQKMFHDETACLKYLERIRWPNGFESYENCQIKQPLLLISSLKTLLQPARLLLVMMVLNFQISKRLDLTIKQ